MDLLSFLLTILLYAHSEDSFLKKKKVICALAVYEMAPLFRSTIVIYLLRRHSRPVMKFDLTPLTRPNFHCPLVTVYVNGFHCDFIHYNKNK